MSLDSDPIDQAFPDAPAPATYSGGDPIDEAFKDKGSPLTTTAATDTSAFAKSPYLASLRAVGENALSSVGGMAGSLADAVTGAVPGTHDWAYRPRSAEGQALAGVVGKAGQAVTNTAADTAADVIGSMGGDTGAASQTLRERIPEALGAVGAVSGLGGLARGVSGAPAEAAGAASSTAAREGVLQRVGIQDARMSAIEGNPSEAATDYQMAKLDNPAGRRMKSVIDGERQALSDHADGIVDRTGGTPGSAADESTKLERGQNIIKPLDDLKDYFDTQTRSLYTEADSRAQGAPQPLRSFQDLLGDDSQMTNSDRVQLRTALNSYLGKLKMVGDDGTVSGNPMQAETVRKYLNENWSPQNSKLVGKMKDALDDDVTQAAGSDIYAQARSMRTLKGNTLDNPNGIAKLMDSSGPEGINRAVPTEKIADTLTSMPVAQFNHVVDTLKNLPPEIQPSGDAALAEIRAHLASKVADAGQSTSGMWNAKAVSQVLSKNSARLQSVFDPVELSKFDDLDQAGQILKKDQSYPGAAVQEHNLVQRGAMEALRTGGTALGAHLFGPVGAVGGEAIGGKSPDAMELERR